MGYQNSGNRSCPSHSGNYNGDNYGNNKEIQKKCGIKFHRCFNRKSFGDSSTWRCN